MDSESYRCFIRSANEQREHMKASIRRAELQGKPLVAQLHLKSLQHLERMVRMERTARDQQPKGKS